MNMEASSSPHARIIRTWPEWPSILAGAGASTETRWARGVESLRARELSLVVHLLAAVLLLFPLFNGIVNKSANGAEEKFVGGIIFPGMPTEKVAGALANSKGGGGGGEHNPIPARHGGLPQFDWSQLRQLGIPRNPQPKLTVNQTLLGPPEIAVPATNLIGDPLSSSATDSQGSGSNGGFGKGNRGGIGDGDGGGAGQGKKWGIGGGEPQPPGRNGVGYPECVYCPTPTFSEEARKSKMQGSVTLYIVVGTDGRVTNIRVARGVGMGLDERAVEAVRGWRFKPALGPGGKPVPTEVLIEVTFRLL
jgi:TonB family protein